MNSTANSPFHAATHRQLVDAWLNTQSPGQSAGRRLNNNPTLTCLNITIRLGVDDCIHLRQATTHLSGLESQPVGSELLDGFVARYGTPLGVDAMDVTIPEGGVLPARGETTLLSQCASLDDASSAGTGVTLGLLSLGTAVLVAALV